MTLTPAQLVAAYTPMPDSVASYFNPRSMPGAGPGVCIWTSGTVAGIPSRERDLVAWILAKTMMQARCGRTGVFEKWHDAALGNTVLSDIDKKVISSFIQPVFGTRAKPRPALHTSGYIAEWLWYEVHRAYATGGRSIEFQEPPKFHVTAPGNDGFAVYAANGQAFFRLWEIKQHTNGSTSASSAINEAYDQLNTRGAEYLAEVAGPLSMRDDGVGQLAKELPVLWITGDHRAGAGVGVTTSNTRHPSSPFAGMGAKFPGFAQSGQLEAVFLSVDDFSEFANQVKDYIWMPL